MENLDTSMFYDPKKTRTYNALFNFILGNRRSGKTYGTVKDCIDRFIKKGETFVYLRRYKTELKKFRKLIEPHLRNNEFDGHEVEVKGSVIFVDGKEAGYGIPLSTGKIEKGSNPENVGTIIFDEYLIEKGVYHYLQDEVTVFLEFLISVSSYRPVITFFISNAISITNPYFLYFNLKVPAGDKMIWRKGELLVELVNDPNFIEYVKKTRIGKFLTEQAPEYADYAIQNQFYLDDDEFIEPIPSNAKPMFNMIYNGITLGVWKTDEHLYVSDKYEPSLLIVYSITMDDHRKNQIYFKYRNKNNSIRIYMDMYKLALVRFTSVNVKNLCYDIFKIMTL